eukprot:SAG22_NODE_14242_length_380_cov_1.313167_1_plen_54_part_00
MRTLSRVEARAIDREAWREVRRINLCEVAGLGGVALCSWPQVLCTRHGYVHMI